MRAWEHPDGKRGGGTPVRRNSMGKDKDKD